MMASGRCSSFERAARREAQYRWGVEGGCSDVQRARVTKRQALGAEMIRGHSERLQSE
jgi:hypothetical protein